MAKEKACRICNTVFEGSECPNCGSRETSDSFKGKVIVFNPEKSEIAGKLNIKKAGVYAIKNR